MRALRRARGITQDQLAARARLSADTIRRIEHGSFSPSLESIAKLCSGLELSLTSLFGSFEVGELAEDRELTDALQALDDGTRRLALELVRVVARHR